MGAFRAVVIEEELEHPFPVGTPVRIGRFDYGSVKEVKKSAQFGYRYRCSRDRGGETVVYADEVEHDRS